MILIILLPLTLAIVIDSFDSVYAQPSISDAALNVEAAVEGLSSPTRMAFLDDNNILVLEKERFFVWCNFGNYFVWCSFIRQHYLL